MKSSRSKKNESMADKRKYNEKLIDAALYGLVDDVQLALNKGADVNARDEIDNTALIWASSNNKVDIIKVLLKNNADTNSRNRIGWTPLISSAYHDNAEAVKVLLESKLDLDVNAKDNSGITALMWAALKDNKNIVEDLLKAKADPDMKDSSGRNVLFHALESDPTEIVKNQFEHGVDDVEESEKFLEFKTSRLEILELLISVCSDINSRDKQGTTPLMLAVEKGNTAAVKLFLARGANFEMKNGSGQTALEIASKNELLEIEQILLEHLKSETIGEDSKKAQDKEKTSKEDKEKQEAKKEEIAEKDKNKDETSKKEDKEVAEEKTSKEEKHPEEKSQEEDKENTTDDKNEAKIKSEKENQSKGKPDEDNKKSEMVKDDPSKSKEEKETDTDKTDIDEKKDTPSEEEEEKFDVLSELEKEKAEQKENSIDNKTPKSWFEKQMEIEKLQAELAKEHNKKIQPRKNDSNNDFVVVPEIGNDYISFEELSDVYLKNLPPKIVQGKVAMHTENEVIVDILLRARSVISRDEFAGLDEINQNDKVMVYIENIEHGGKKVQLSKRKADFYLNYDKLKKIYEENTTVDGYIRKTLKKGMLTTVLGMEAFMPRKEISDKPLENYNELLGKQDRFKIIKLDEEHSNIVVSRRKVIEEEIEARKKRLKEKIQIEAEFTGEIKRIVDYGIYVDIGGIEGLLHISDMPIDISTNPSEMFKIDDAIQVKVIGYDHIEDILYLALKQQSPNSWEYIISKYTIRSKAKAKVVNFANYGAIVQLEPGVEGLIHLSEMSWTKKVHHPNKILKLGQEVDVIVISVSKEAQQIGLSMKQLIANPWLTIDKSYPIGSTIKKKIKSVTSFGIFIDLGDDINGLIHVTDISWTNCEYDPSSIFHPGDDIESKVLAIDKPFHRISLGIKQLTEDPWQNIGEVKEDTEVEGTITHLTKQGLTVDVKIGDNVIEGFVPTLELALENLVEPVVSFHIGEKIPLHVFEFDAEDRRFILSIKSYYENRDKKELEEFQMHREKLLKEVANKE